MQAIDPVLSKMNRTTEKHYVGVKLADKNLEKKVNYPVAMIGGSKDRVSNLNMKSKKH